MAQGILKHQKPSFDVYSAGVQPAAEIHPLAAIPVMEEIDMDITLHYPKHVEEYLNQLVG